MDRFIAGLPKVDLHAHHVGSAPPRLFAELRERGVWSRASESPPPNRFTDLEAFTTHYVSLVDLIRTAEDVRALTFEVARELARQNIRYAELTVTPYSSVRRGIRGEDFIAAIEDARIEAESDLRVVLRWCFDIPGDARAGLAAAEETLRLALEADVPGLVSLGLGGRESAAPRERFKPYFDRARAAGLHSAPHAGETVGPESIWMALEMLGAERIGHGVSALEDKRLTATLVERRIPLEVCLTSNVATGAVSELEAHPILRMAEAGVRFTVNTDDAGIFHTDLNTEYEIAAELLGLDEAGVTSLAMSAVDAAFIESHAKRALHMEIDDYCRRWFRAAGRLCGDPLGRNRVTL